MDQLAHPHPVLRAILVFVVHVVFVEVVVIRPELSGSALPLFEEVAAVGTAPDFGVAADAHGPVGVYPRAHAVAQLVHRGSDCRGV